MERLGAGLEGSGKSFKDLKSHPFFAGVEWESISKSTTLPFPREETLNVLNES